MTAHPIRQDDEPAFARALASQHMTMLDEFAKHAPPPPDDWLARYMDTHGHHPGIRAEADAAWRYTHAAAMLARRAQIEGTRHE